jgi:signal peptidase I
MESSPQQVSPAALESPAPPPAQTLTPEPSHSAGRGYRTGGVAASIGSLCVTLIVAIFVITFIVQAFQIPSQSMENTLLIGDYLLVDKAHYGTGGVWGEMLPYVPVRRGDIIVFRYPVHPSQYFVKRVIGVPGDRVRLVNKKVFVNGRTLREPYAMYRSGIHDSYRDEFPDGVAEDINGNVEVRWWMQMRHLIHNGELVIPRGMYFVMGDNRDESLDSRYWGFVPRENIVGRPLVIYWSMDETPVDGGTIGDRISQLAYVVSHMFQEARWGRALRLIN